MYPLTPAEMRQLIKLWDKVRWPAPEELFEAHCRNEVAIAVELAVLRKQGKKYQVLLIERKDKFFKGWHMPGSLLLPGENIKAVIRRLKRREVTVLITKPQFIGIHESHSRRSSEEVGLLHICYTKGSTPKNGEFFDISHLPQGTLLHHRWMLRAVRQHLAR